MWSIGSEEYRDTAKIQLLQCNASDPGNVTAIGNLAGMGILSNDETLVDAALSELLDMPIEQRQQLDPADDVNYLLAQQSFIQGNHRKAFMYAQHSLHAIPSNLRARNRLATVALQQQERRAALAILLGGQSDINQNSLALGERLCLLAATYALGDSPSEIQLGLRVVQRAIVLFPSNLRPWQTLAFVRSRSA
jgi:superkiller protein 3